MTPFNESHFTVAVREQKYSDKSFTLVESLKPPLRHRLCIRLGDWLTNAGDWLKQRADYQNGSANELELA